MSTTARWHNGRLVYMDTARMASEVEPAMRTSGYIFEDFQGVAGTDISGYKNFVYTLDAGLATLETASGAHGVAKISSSATEDDVASVSGPHLNYLPSRNPVLEVRAALESATLAALFVGFSDQLAEAAGASAYNRTHGDATYTSTATDAVGFLYDGHQASDLYIHGVGVNNGTDITTPVETGIALVANTFKTFRLELVDNGSQTTAYFYIDGVLYGSMPSCIGRAVPICLYIAVSAREANDKYMYIDYIKAYEKVA